MWREDKIKNKLGQITSPSFPSTPLLESTISGVTLLIILMVCLKSVKFAWEKECQFRSSAKPYKVPRPKGI